MFLLSVVQHLSKEADADAVLSSAADAAAAMICKPAAAAATKLEGVCLHFWF